MQLIQVGALVKIKNLDISEMILFIIIVLKFHINMITLKEDSHHG